MPASGLAVLLDDRVPDRQPLLADLGAVPLGGRAAAMAVVVVAVFVASGAAFADQGWGVLAVYLLAAAPLVALAFIDLSTLRLPDRIVVPMLALAIPAVTAVSLAQDRPAAIRYALLGSAIYFGFLFLAHLAFPAGMGFGDVKLAAVMGLLVGWQATSASGALVLVLYALVVGFVAGSAAGIVLYAVRGRSAAIPFGPFLVLGTVVVALAAPELLPAGA